MNKSDEHGNTLLHIASQNGNIKIAKLLVHKGINPNHQNKQGQTPGHFAIAYQFSEFAVWLFDPDGAGADDMLENVHGLGVYDGLNGEDEADDNNMIKNGESDDE
jgi:ankyrin repeat protein